MPNTNNPQLIMNWVITDYFGQPDPPAADYGDDFDLLIPHLIADPMSQPTQLRVWCGDRIDAIQMSYGGYLLNKHGGGGGALRTLDLDSRNPVRSILFYTTGDPPRLGRFVVSFEGGQSTSFGNTDTTLRGALYFLNGYQLGGFFGYFHAEVNAFGAITIPVRV